MDSMLRYARSLGTATLHSAKLWDFSQGAVTHTENKKWRIPQESEYVWRKIFFQGHSQIQKLSLIKKKNKLTHRQTWN